MRRLRARVSGNPWLLRTAVVGALVILLAAGFATATLAGKGSVPTNNPPTTTPPPPPPEPPDPLKPPTTAPESSVTKGQKHLTIAELRGVLVGTASFLGDCLTPPATGVDKGSTDPVLCYIAAQAIITEALHEYYLNTDPPDPNFTQVALGVPAPAPKGGYKCPKKAKKANCAAVNAALQKYLTAVNVNAQAMGGATITMNRFSGAVAAKSVSGALLQAAARKAYSGLLVTTKAAQQAAGAALALTMRKTHLDHLPTKAECQARNKKLSSSKGLPRPVIDRLVNDGQIKTAADLDPVLKGVATVPCVPTSTGVGQALYTAEDAAHWHSTTYKDYAVLIRGLVGQNAVPNATGNKLLDELRTIANTASADARKPLLDKLQSDAAAVGGPAGILLGVGAGGLS